MNKTNELTILVLAILIFAVLVWLANAAIYFSTYP